MKSYREIADNVFARREQYMAAQRKKKQFVARATVSVGSVALVSLAGFALFKNDAFHETPPVATSTTTTHSPATEGTLPTTTAADSTTVTTAATTPIASATAPSKTDPTATTAPSTTAKTEPSETTASTKLLITADEPDYDNFDEMTLSKYETYITPCLQEMMERYEGADVVYAVIVSIPPMHEDYKDDFWNDTAELMQWKEKYENTYNAFVEEAKRLNPSWDDGNANNIEVWTDTMRANYKYALELIDERNLLIKKHLKPYVESVLTRRFNTLRAMCNAEPIDVLCAYMGGDIDVYHHAYYVELTAERINSLAKQGGYTFRLSSPDQKDYGYWDVDE